MDFFNLLFFNTENRNIKDKIQNLKTYRSMYITTFNRYVRNILWIMWNICTFYMTIQVHEKKKN